MNPQLKCNGKCHLKKELAKEEKKEKQLPNIFKEKAEINTIYPSIHLNVSVQEIEKNYLILNDDKLCQTILFGVFHPPPLI